MNINDKTPATTAIRLSVLDPCFVEDIVWQLAVLDTDYNQGPASIASYYDSSIYDSNKYSGI